MPILGDSGNGGHLLWRVDLAANDGGLLEHCLAALEHLYPNDGTKVDRSVFNPARLWKAYGSLAGKGDSIPDRPHRPAKVIEAPDRLEVVSVGLLEALAARAPTPEPQTTSRVAPRPALSGIGHVPTWSVEAWIEKNRPALDRYGLGDAEPWNGGRRWIFKVCPWTGEEHAGTAGIFEQADGKVGASCRGDRCAGKDWHALRDVIEPRWREQAEAKCEKKDNRATKVVQLVLESGVELFHSKDGDAFVAAPVGQRIDTWPLRSRTARSWIRRLCYLSGGGVVGTQAVEDSLGVLEGKALHEGQEVTLHTRIGEHDGRVCIDLVNSAG